MTVDPSLVAHEGFQALRAGLKHAFPDDRSQLSDALVATVGSLLPAGARLQLFGDVAALVESEGLRLLAALDHQPDAPEVRGYFLAKATHTRYGADRAVVHRFAGLVPMVHWVLPSTQAELHSKLGTLYPGDTPYYTLPIFNEHYRPFGLEDASEVHVVSPARYLGARFAALSTMAARPRPLWVIVAGLATGESVVSYASPLGGEIERREWYVPTPFSADTNRALGAYHDLYDGTPLSMHIEIRGKDEQAPHVIVDVTYEKMDAPVPVWPAELTLQAACRVALIGEKLGRPLGGGLLPLVQPILADVARNLDWEIKP
jgi:hypothetical protein